VAKLPIVSGQQVGATLERLGYSKNRQRGSHVIYIREGSIPITVPMHKELATGTLASIIRESCADRAKFLEELR